MAFARWDPWQDLLALHERMHRLAGQDPTPGWMPAVDLYETDKRYVMTAELPGLARDDIRIHVDNGVLVIDGERHPDHAPDVRFHRIERGHGPFRRAFRLPQPVAADEITAETCDGVVTVLIPKLAPQQRRIEVI
jgi:HSP20 family protein